MRNWISPRGVTALILLLFVFVPVLADIQDQLVNYLGEAELGYQKDANDYLREARKQKAECLKLSSQYDEIRRSELTEGWLKYTIGTPPGYANILFNPTPEQRAVMADTGWDKDFMASNATARQYWGGMKTACKNAEKNYNAAYSKTRADDYGQHAVIFGESAGIYDTIGDPEGAGQVREAKEVAEERAAAKDIGFSDCLIVTATFGSPMATEVQLVRDFRDDTVKRDYLGSRYVTALNAIYYSFSPAVARFIDTNPSVKPAMRIILAPLLAIVLLSKEIYTLLSFSPVIATVVFIIVGGTLVGLAYVLPVMLPALWLAAKRRWQVPATGTLRYLVIVWAGLLAALLAGTVIRIDILAVLSSGLLFACTVLLSAGATALYLLEYFNTRPAGMGK